MKSFQQWVNEEQSKFHGFLIPRSEMPQIDDHQKFIDLMWVNGINVIDKTVGILFVKPTQIDYDPEKVQKMINKKVLIGSDGYILDGHHTYYSKLLSGQNFIDVYQADAPINILLKLCLDHFK